MPNDIIEVPTSDAEVLRSLVQGVVLSESTDGEYALKNRLSRCNICGLWSVVSVSTMLPQRHREHRDCTDKAAPSRLGRTKDLQTGARHRSAIGR